MLHKSGQIGLPKQLTSKSIDKTTYRTVYQHTHKKVSACAVFRMPVQVEEVKMYQPARFLSALVL